MAETGQPYAYTGDDPVNEVDPLGLSWYNPSWAHKAVHRLARGAAKVGHFVATHKKAVVTAAIIIATIPLDATGAGEAIDAEAIAADVAADATETAVEGAEEASEAAEEGAQEAGEQASEEPAEEGPSCGGQSFSSGTQVQLANGSKIPISQVRVGDMVLATNTRTNKLQAEPVTALWVNHDDDLMDVTLKTASGSSSTIQSTQYHLFWDLNTHTWVQADDLSIGTSLRTSNGATATVVSTTIIPGAADMWDLTVNDDHDFYVAVSIGSQTAVLVHNCPERSSSRLTNSQAQDMAERVGYRSTSRQSMGQRIFTNGRNFITQDVTSHSGGLWKMAGDIDGFGPASRLGTFDYDLNYIGP